MAGAPFEPLFGNTQAKYDTLQFHWIMSLNRLVNIAIFWHEAPVRTMQDFDAFYRLLVAKVPARNVTSRFSMERLKATTAYPLTPNAAPAGGPRLRSVS